MNSLEFVPFISLGPVPFTSTLEEAQRLFSLAGLMTRVRERDMWWRRLPEDTSREAQAAINESIEAMERLGPRLLLVDDDVSVDFSRTGAIAGINFAGWSRTEQAEALPQLAWRWDALFTSS